MKTIAFTCSKAAGETPARDRVFLYDRYLRAFLQETEKAGFTGLLPVLLPSVGEVSGEAVRRFDGFVLTGGGDVDPSWYGEEREPLCGASDAERDAFEMALFREASALLKPILGICRGIQVINVALGGTLWQDLPSQHPGTHATTDGTGEPRHPVTTAGFLRTLTGREELTVNSYHHQAVKTLGGGLRAAGVSRDGVVEAVEHLSLPYCRAVQWHPELNPDWVSYRLFADFAAHL